MTGSGQPGTAMYPSFGVIDVLGPALLTLDSVSQACVGDPVALRATAQTWAKASSDLSEGVSDGLDTARGRVNATSWTGAAHASFERTSSGLSQWLADTAGRKARTGRSLADAATLLENGQLALSGVKADLIRAAAPRVALELARGGSDMGARAVAVAAPYITKALTDGVAVRDQLSHELFAIAGDLDEQAVATAPNGKPASFMVELFGKSLFPTSWLPRNLLTWGDVPGLFVPQEPARLSLAGSYGLMNVVAESKRVGLGYALMTSPLGIFRNMLTDTSQPMTDPFAQPIWNGLGHAAWGAAGSFGSEWAATKLNDWARDGLENRGVLDWMRTHKLLDPHEPYQLYSGVPRYLAATNATTSFLLTVKDPFFVDAGLSTLDADGRVHPKGLVGEAASLGYDAAAVAGPAAGFFGLERWNATGDLGQVKKTICAEVLVGSSGVLLQRALDDGYDSYSRVGFGGGALGSIAATALCDGFVPPPGPPTAGGVQALPIDLHDRGSFSSTHGVDLRNWQHWAHDPELNPAYAASPQHRWEAGLAELGMETGFFAGAALLGYPLMEADLAGAAGAAVQWGARGPARLVTAP